MLKKITFLCFIALVLMVPMTTMAQIDFFGEQDTLFTDIAKIDNSHWSVTVSYNNDQLIAGFSIPFKLYAGATKIVADSANYADGRVRDFARTVFRADTTIQCVQLGAIGSLMGPKKRLLPGSGKLFTLYVSSLDGKPIEKLIVDTTTLQPNNTLMFVADSDELSKLPKMDSAGFDNRVNILPEFIVRQIK